MIILGIDPGSRRTGWGVVRVGPGGTGIEVVAHGTLAGGTGPLTERLVALGRGLEEVLDRHRPEVVGVEQAFHARNVRSTLVLGHVRGLVLWLAAGRGLAVAEYAPRAVKLAVTGRGGASKPQVADMVRRLLALEARPSGDAADALAVALCCARRGRLGANPAAARVPEAAGAAGPAARGPRTARASTGETIDLSRAFARVRPGREEVALERLALARGARPARPARPARGPR
jgi:crossover junction endodeoxyribonuclease RuvC